MVMLVKIPLKAVLVMIASGVEKTKIWSVGIKVATLYLAMPVMIVFSVTKVMIRFLAGKVMTVCVAVARMI
jgi:hypothetical protein